MSMFKQAVKHEAKLRMSIAGPSGSGKTYSALAIATALVGKDGKIAVVDTEHGSAAKYSDIFTFDVLEMQPPYHPDRFVEAIKDASAAGYDVIILDSMTHAWSGSGGMLDVVDEIAKRKGGNSYVAWKDGTPIQNRLVDAIVAAKIHVITTMRSKMDYSQDKDDKGKTVIRKVGMAPQQREGFEYEMDVALDMNIDNEAVVSKTRCPALNARVFSKPGKDVANILRVWLEGAPVVRKEEVTTQPLQGENHQERGQQSVSAPPESGEVWEQWDNPTQAYAWAVSNPAIKDVDTAKAAFKHVVETNFGGKLSTSNKEMVFRLYYDHIKALELDEDEERSLTLDNVPEMAF